MSVRVFHVPSLEGEESSRAISAALRRAPGIVGVTVDVGQKQVCVDFDSALINEAQVMQLMRDAGYEAQ